MSTAYAPQPGSAGARAIEYLQRLGEGAEASSAQLATELSLNQNAMSAILVTVVRHKLVARVQRHGKSYWRLGDGGSRQAAPPPDPGGDSAPDDDSDADLAPIARTISSTTAPPIPGVVRQSWCPAAQNADASSSLGEPPASHPNPPVAPSPGLGWVAPRHEPGITSESAGGEQVVEASKVDDETVLALSAALAPLPVYDESQVVDAEFDPDFVEVMPDMPDRAPREPVHIDMLPPDPPPFPVPARAPAPSEFRCALWSDGRLHVETYPGSFLFLTKEETEQLLDYLDRMREPAE